ncbi:hypothetical protein [Chryseolinea soli]|uniref:Uncharacterized protein n=1 Tax=Chryseolinea soli TaxID=2321403 RepID=A0A385SPS6_9BACT|nr:hypothetical protein [Chryseolinea soli]AYB32852.1 hypothetical protein D4L85_20715 [Chryseolinea soli]
MKSTNDYVVSSGDYETPFSDESLLMERPEETSPTPEFYSSSSEFESPFSATYNAEDSISLNQPKAEAFVELLAELNHEDFKESLMAMAGEIEESVIARFSYEGSHGNHYPYLKQRTSEYIAPLLREVDAVIDRASQAVSSREFEGLSAENIERFVNEMEFEYTEQLSPAQEQFLGGLVNKVKSAVKAGAKLVNKLNPINLALNKLKGLIKPLLNKVLNTLVGKLPQPLQPYARDLAKKFLKLEVPTQDGALNNSNEMFAGEDFEQLSYEFDLRMANLVFANDEVESEQFVNDYIEEGEHEDPAYENAPSLDEARQQFVDQLRRGEDVQPALEQFLPALYPAIKVALSLVGRKRVINFLAGLLGKLVGKYVPANIAKPLSASIVDLGFKALGFETADQNNESLAYEAIANTVEETIRTLGTEDEGILQQLDGMSDSEAIDQLAEHVLPAFSKAVANNFPGTYIRKSIQPTREPGVWVLMPRRRRRKSHKRFSRVYPVTLTAALAEGIKTFGDVSLKDFVKDTMGQDLAQPINVRVHVYEAIPGTTLNKISLYDRAPGLGTADKSAAVQLHPLSVQAATALLNDPGIGKDVAPEFTTSREKITIGQRFFYMEMPGAVVRRPRVHRRLRRAGVGVQREAQVAARSSDIQAVFNFVKSEVVLNFFFSEAGSNDVVEKLNRQDWIGASESLRKALKSKLNKALLKNIRSKVKIVHEAVPELYLRHVPDSEEFLGGFKKMAMEKIIEKVTQRLLGKAFEGVKTFFKTRAKEFSDALAQPDDGVTVRITWKNVAGMAQIRAVISLLRGEGSITNLGGISMPSLPTPTLTILAGKNFI